MSDAEIFNQLNNPVLVWKPVSKHHHCVLLSHPTDLYVVAMWDPWHWRLVTTKASCGAHRRGRTDIPEPLAGAGSSCLERAARPGSSPDTGWKEPGSRCWPWGAELTLSAGPCWDCCLRWSLQGWAPPCTGTWLMEGWRAHRAFPSQEPRPCAHWGCKTRMEHGLCNQCVALSKASQDMLQTPQSSQTYPSLGNCCMQTPTLAMAIKTRNGLHLIPLNTDTYHS